MRRYVRMYKRVPENALDLYLAQNLGLESLSPPSSLSSIDFTRILSSGNSSRLFIHQERTLNLSLKGNFSSRLRQGRALSRRVSSAISVSSFSAALDSYKKRIRREMIPIGTSDSLCYRDP